MRRRAYKFTDKKHSKGGIRSSIVGLVSSICTFVSVYEAYVTKGDGARYLAAFGFISLLLSVYGTFVGYFSFREEESYYLFSGIGTFVNGVLLLFWLAVFGMGFII